MKKKLASLRKLALACAYAVRTRKKEQEKIQSEYMQKLELNRQYKQKSHVKKDQLEQQQL